MLLTKKVRRPPAAATPVRVSKAAVDDTAPVRRRLPAARRQQDVVQAVLGLAVTLDPGAITTVAIAERVGVTHGALFRHFADKEAIWAAVFGWVSGALGEAVDRAFREGRDPLDTLGRVFMAHVGFVAEHPGVPRILFHELQRPGNSAARGRLRELVLGYRKRLVALLDSARAARQVDADLDTEAAAVLFIGTVQGIVLQETLFARAGSMQTHARRIFPLLLHGYYGARR